MSVAQFMAYVHASVNEISKAYLLNDRRHNYTTPKSYLELINLYVKVLSAKHEEVKSKMGRLENGLEKLRDTAAQVNELKAQLATQEVELTKKNDEADKLIEIVSRLHADLLNPVLSKMWERIVYNQLYDFLT